MTLDARVGPRSALRGSALSALTFAVACAAPAQPEPAAVPGEGSGETAGGEHALVTPVAEATAAGREVVYRAGERELHGFIAYPDGEGDRRPGVLVVHEFWGLNDYARMRARKLSQMGYVALAVDMYGEGKSATHPDDARKFSTEVMQNLEEGAARFDAAAEFLRADPRVDPDRVAAIGYCFGGAIVLHMARVGSDLDAVASFHGGLKTEHPMPPGGFAGEIFVAHGGADAFIPQEHVDAFRNEMETAGVRHEVIVYPGATHSFTNPAATENGKKFGLPVEYNPAADEASWQTLGELLRRVFAKKN